MGERVLTLRELNRAILARQLLLERASLRPLAAIKHLIALQAQVANAPYIGLWTRLQSFERDELTTLLERREAVRASSLRITLHLLTSADYSFIHPLLQLPLSRTLHLFASQARDLALEQVLEQIRAYLQDQPRTGAELRARMDEIYPGLGENRIADAVRMYLGIVQAFPAGTWGFTGKPTLTEASQWLGQPLSAPSETGLQELVRRYLAAFGPASVKDIQTWSGLARLQSVVEALRVELLVFRDEQGRELFDLPDAPRPDADTPAPVRFLPEYDNLLLSHADRTRVIAKKDRPAVFVGSAGVRATFLLDGFVRGTWKIARNSAGTNLVLEPFEPLPTDAQNALQEEGERLLRWAYGDAAGTIAWQPPL